LLKISDVFKLFIIYDNFCLGANANIFFLLLDDERINLFEGNNLWSVNYVYWELG
jgi:hypothetical protein